MASVPAPRNDSSQGERATLDTRLATELGRVFRHVAVFALDGTLARATALHGIPAAAHDSTVSLLDQTPLRWSIESASPTIGAGRGPGGNILAAVLGLPRPRTYAVIPMVQAGAVCGLAYADGGEAALKLADVSATFALCQILLEGSSRVAASAGLSASAAAPSRPPPVPARAALSPRAAAVAHTAVTVAKTPPRVNAPPEDGAPFAALLAPPYPSPSRAVVVSTAPPPRASGHRVIGQLQRLGVVTPAGVLPLDPALMPPRGRRWSSVALGLVASAALFFASQAMAPPPRSIDVERAFTVPRQASLGLIAERLEQDGIIRNARAFSWLAQMSGRERHLRAGTYRLRPRVWAWEVLRDLSGGQVATVQVTVPEGLSVREVASLLESHNVALAPDFIAAARDPTLLAKYDLQGESAEGYLFPETYTFALGLSATQVVESMLEQFGLHLTQIPQAMRASREELRLRLILASIIEKEARAESELRRVAGVFENRLARNMKLESCATIQYTLDHPKEHLSLADVRRPSPYNTYLNYGLPPGPITNPGLAALRAAFEPERHDFLFFFAKGGPAHAHVFSRTYAEHLSSQKLLARRD